MWPSFLLLLFLQASGPPHVRRARAGEIVVACYQDAHPYTREREKKKIEAAMRIPDLLCRTGSLVVVVLLPGSTSPGRIFLFHFLSLVIVDKLCKKKNCRQKKKKSQGHCWRETGQWAHITITSLGRPQTYRGNEIDPGPLITHEVDVVVVVVVVFVANSLSDFFFFILFGFGGKWVTNDDAANVIMGRRPAVVARNSYFAAAAA